MIPARGLPFLSSLFLVCGLASAIPLQAQRIQGRVERQGEGVDGVEVTLHRVTGDTAGVVATAITGPAGRFTFPDPPADTVGFSVLFTTAEYQGVRYFGAPLHAGERPDPYTVEVWDTTSTPAAGGEARVARRDIVLIPTPDGGWEVDELVQLRNPGSETIVPASGVPTLQLRIPEGVAAFEVGPGETPPDEVQRMEDRLLLTSPLVPGIREILYRYRIAGGEEGLRFPVALPTDSVNLFIRQPSPPVEPRGLQGGSVVPVQQERFLRYVGADFASGDEFALEWEGDAAPPVDPTLAAAGVTALLLALGSWIAFRRGAPS